MAKNQNKKAIMLALIGLFFILLGTSYAIFSNAYHGLLETTITTDGIAFKYTEGANNIALSEAFPISDEEGKNLSSYFEFYISGKAKADMEIPYYITVRKTNTSSNIDDAIKLYLTKVDKNGNEEIVTLTKFSEIEQYDNAGIDLSKYVEKLLHSDKITGNKIYKETYRLRMWISDDINFGDEKYQNATFGLTVNVYSNGKVELKGTNILDDEVLAKVTAIRSTPNTDVSDRTGNVYYVSLDGNDSNDGLSEATPWKSMDKVHEMFKNKEIHDGDAILFRDGDRFYGKFEIKYVNDILIGSYGDISKGKPLITRSPYNGATEGEWTEVKPNIWKYTYNGEDPFIYDVGVIWFFCNEGNDNCDKSMNTIDQKFMYTKKIMKYKDYDETDIEDKIDTILTNDLEIYHTGHPNARNPKGKTLYLYSKGNPAERFDRIEFAQAYEPIFVRDNLGGSNYRIGTVKIDNIKIQYTSSSGILLWADVSNFVVTNCEIGFIGGAVHSFDAAEEIEGAEGTVTQYGNGINLYGSVREVNGVPVTDGFVVKNNYVYQCFDAGVSFQKSVTDEARMEKAWFKDNVLENSNYNIEYWTYIISDDPEVIEGSYIGDALYEDNILRNAGFGVCETRPNRGNAAHLKNWQRKNGYNILKGTFEIKNNIFVGAQDQFIFLNSSYYSSLPTFINNTFYGKSTDKFGYYYSTDRENSKKAYYFDRSILDTMFPNNNFIVVDENLVNDSGTTGDVNWSFDASTNTLSISGTGNMADYTAESLAPWDKYKNNIYKIVIGENVTKLGEYAFYNLKRVNEIRINSKLLSDLVSTTSESNYTFYNTGSQSLGTKLVFGSEVTVIPANLTRPVNDGTSAPHITNIEFEGNKLTRINTYGLTGTENTELKLPQSVTTLTSSSLGKNKSIRFFVGGDSLTNYGGWVFREDSVLEKLLIGENVNTIKEATFRACYGLKTIVIPSIKTPSTADANTFQYVKNNVDIYGDSSVETWLNTIKAASGQTNLIYHPIEEYRSTITSNTGINTTVGYNDTYSFTASGNVTIKMYYDATDGNRYYVDADYTKSGNTYTINKIKSDIYIEVE